MAFEEWDKYSDGTLAVRSLMRWQGAGTANTGILRLEATGDKSVDEGGELFAVQLALSVEQMRDLGNALLKIVDEITSKSTTTN